MNLEPLLDALRESSHENMGSHDAIPNDIEGNTRDFDVTWCDVITYITYGLNDPIDLTFFQPPTPSPTLSFRKESANVIDKTERQPCSFYK